MLKCYAEVKKTKINIQYYGKWMSMYARNNSCKPNIQVDSLCKDICVWTEIHRHYGGESQKGHTPNCYLWSLWKVRLEGPGEGKELSYLTSYNRTQHSRIAGGL